MTENRVPSHRPLGVSLAIVLCAILFAFIPLTELGVRVFVQARLANIDNVEITLPDGSVVRALASGGYEDLVNPTALISQLVVCGWVLLVCVMAWRGRPRGIRWVFTLTVVTLAALTAYATLRSAIIVPSILEGVSSGDEVGGFQWVGALFSALLLPLYTVWYMNRAPARAFFRSRAGG